MSDEGSDAGERETPPRERVAVLLGAASPWGRVVAETLARDGYALWLLDARSEALELTREKVLEAGAEAEVDTLSYGDLPSIFATASHGPASLDAPQLLVHVLPPPVSGRFSERSPEGIVEEVHRGYSSLVVLARCTLPRMIRIGGGRVIVVGSAAARAPMTKAAVHTALAYALPPFLTSLDREVHREGIRVSYLEPQGFASPPVPPVALTGRRPLHAAHRKFHVSDDALARAFGQALRHPGVRTLRFHGGEGTPPPPGALQRYAEREFHARHPEDRRARWAPRHHPPEDLRGKIAVVTGGSRGIGRSIGHRLAHLGMRVVLTSRDEKALRQAASEVDEKGGEARIFPQDLTVPGAPERILRFTQETWGDPWLLVNNAGLGCYRRLLKQDLSQIASQVQLDLVALLATTRTFLPTLLSHGTGEVLNVGSMAPEVPLPRLAPYAGLKGAVKGFSLALGREVRHRGLNVSVLEPVTVDTDFIATANEPGRTDVRMRPWARSVIIHPREVGLLAERTVVDPRPVVIVPPRTRPLLWIYRGLRPVLEPMMRLPPMSTEGGSPARGADAST